jgi:hypothetical protein
MRDVEQRDDEIASGTLPADAEEDLVRLWERRDREAAKSESLTEWLSRATAFSPGECAILAASVQLAYAAIERDSPERLEGGVGEELLRLKAKCEAGESR